MDAVSDPETNPTEPGHGHPVRSSLGALGALATVFSVWWFALRPRRHASDEDTGPPTD